MDGSVRGGCSLSVRDGRRMTWVLLELVLCSLALLADHSYAEVSDSVTAYACQDESLVLECQQGEVIRILRANYGRFTVLKCNSFGQTDGWNLQCMSHNSKDIISERCDGRRHCVMMVNNHVFGDPCPSTSKYAEVRYACQQAPNEYPPYSSPTLSTTQIAALRPRRPLSGSPQPPYITTVVALSPTEIEITWIQAEPVVTTAIYFTDHGMTLGPSTIYTSNKDSLLIEEVRPNTTYDIFLKSFNVHGPSVSSNTVTIMTPPQVTKSGASDEMQAFIRVSTSPQRNNLSSSGTAVDNMGTKDIITNNRMNDHDTNSSNYNWEHSKHRTYDNVGESKDKSDTAEVRNKTILKNIISKVPLTTSEDQKYGEWKLGSVKTSPNYRPPNSPMNPTVGVGYPLSQNKPSTAGAPNTHAIRQLSDHNVQATERGGSKWSETREISTVKPRPSSYADLKTLSPQHVGMLQNITNVEGKRSGSLDDSAGLSYNILLHHTMHAELLQDSTVTSSSTNRTHDKDSSPWKMNNSTPIRDHLVLHKYTSMTRGSLRRYPDRTVTPRPEPSNPVDPVQSTTELSEGDEEYPTTVPATTTMKTTTTTSEQEGDKLPEVIFPSDKGEPAGERPPSEHTGEDGGVNKFCVERLHKGVLWPTTRYGRIAEEECPPALRGMSSWRCVSSGWEKSGPDYSNCISPWLNDLDMPIQNVMQGKAAADVVAIQLEKATEHHQLNSGDLKRAATNLLPMLSEGLLKDSVHEPIVFQKRTMRRFKEAFMKTSSNLLDQKNAQAWQGMTRQDRVMSATSLLIAVEDTGFKAASLMDVGASELTVDENIVMEVNVLSTQKVHNDITFPSQRHMSQMPWSSDSSTITISSTSLKAFGRKDPLNVVFTIYKNMEDLIQPQLNTISSVPASSTSHSTSEAYYNAAIIRDGNNLMEGVEQDAVVIINSKIVSASIDSHKIRRALPDPVKFTLHHLEPSNEATPICSFWDVDLSYMSGKWSHEGCRMLETNSTHTTCECDHLTNFAVLFDVSGTKLSKKLEIGLIWVTYIGCAISIICLMLSWITFMVFKNLQCDRNTIHKNLVLCLMLAEIVFLAGITQTEPKLLCALIAGILHLLFLGAFAWMCLEGVQLYVMLVEVFEQEKSRIRWYYLFGYGLPLLIVGISAAVKHEGYGTDRHCWLSTEDYFIWSFVGPALAVMLINIGMLSIAIYTMCRHTNMSATLKERSKVTKVRAWMKGAVVLVVLLGLTWVFGLLYVNERAVVMAYFFTIINSLQGLFIFIFHCIMNEKVQKEYRKVVRRTAWLPNCIRVNYGGYNGVASTSPNASTGSGNYLSKLLGQRKRRRSASSTTNSAKPFLNKDQHRRSDGDNSSSRDSSTVPSCLNGYVYNPNYSNQKVANANAPFLSNNNGVVKTSQNGSAALTPHYETVDGIAGDLSEYIDCSTVDSEFVSEYCKNNLQIIKEERRYSTGSEDSAVVNTLKVQNMADKDNISNLSLASSCKKPASFVSNSELADGTDYEVINPSEDSKGRLHLDLHQYIIPSTKRVSAVGDQGGSDKSRQENNKSSSMNKLIKPTASLSSIPETETSLQHSSSPNLHFSPGFSMPPMTYLPAQVPFPGSHEAQSVSATPSDAQSPSSVKSSLPNLSNEALTVDCGGEVVDQGGYKRRHSSETDVQFSPFRFSASEC